MRVYYHRVETNSTQDALIYEDNNNKKYKYEALVTYDGDYLMLSTTKGSENVNLYSFTTLKDKDLNAKLSFTPIIDQWIGSFSHIYNIGSKF